MTIYALSSGPGISGIAVIRISGQETSKAIELLTGKVFLNQGWQLLEKSIKSTLLS